MATCTMLQSDSLHHHFAVTYPNSLPIQYFSSSTFLKFRINQFKSHRNLQYSRNLGQRRTLASKTFSYYGADHFSGSGRWEQVRIILASAPGFDPDSSKKEVRADPSLLQNPSDKEDEVKPSNEEPREPSAGPPPERSWWQLPKWMWSWKGTPAVQAHEIGALLLRLSIFVLLMRLLRVPFPGAPSSSIPERSSSAYITVPFSEFLSKSNQNDIESLEIDGFHLTYYLRPSRQARLQKEIQVKVGDEVDQEGPRIDKAEVPGVAQSEKSFQSSPSRRLYYTTTRPFDISIPYDQLKANDVVFGAPDKRPLKMINTLLIFFLYVGLIVGLLGRFSLKLPQRSTGRLRNRKGLLSGGGKDQDSAGAIMFADVAGVDEAKEELEEIVGRRFCRGFKPRCRVRD